MKKSFLKHVIKGAALFCSVIIVLEILIDLYQKNTVELSLEDIILDVITGILFSLFMTSLSFKWKEYYDKKKP
ncbi:hypothetical protein [Christiangramia aquimixticola]|uniref:hypothetical protein n=1 Tax=Christiangramia aquimixticola TaxID=1697558 RepID=UPI003AA817F2